MAKKKGFMTPERKKKLRTLLRKKAAEELKKEQERKAEERLRVIAERCGTKADLDAASMDDLKKICQQFFDMWYSLEGDIYSCSVRSYLRDLQINELAITISDLKDKFIKPSYENKLAKLQEKAAKFAFDNQLQLQINNLTISVSEREEKFIKPTLKKVFKYDNKFAKLHEKAAKFAFAN